MSKLICTLVVLLLLSWDMISSTPLNAAELKEIEAKCLKQQGLSSEERQSMLRKWKFDMDVSKVDKRFKCYMHCVMQEAAWIDSTAQLDIEKYIQQFPVERQIVTYCSDEQADQTDVCDYALGFVNCLWKQNPEVEDLKRQLA